LFNNNLPWWGWVLLAFFGFDDALRLVTSAWIFPVLILAGAFFTLYRMNMIHIVTDFYYDIEDFVMRKKKQIFK
jgi:hypothetical protein